MKLRSTVLALLIHGGVHTAYSQGTPLIQWDAPFSGRILGIAFTPEGNEIVTAINDGQGSGSVVRWDRSNGTIKGGFGASSGIECFAMSPDGSFVATATFDTVRIFDRISGNLVKSLATSAKALAFSPDNQLLATADLDGVLVWNWSAGTHGNLLPAPRAVQLDFSPDGMMLGCGTGLGQQDYVRIWNTGDWSLRATVGAVANHQLQFSHDSKKLAWASHQSGGTIGLFDLVANRIQWIRGGWSSEARFSFDSFDDELLCTGVTPRLGVSSVDLSSGRLLYLNGAGGEVLSASPSRREFAVSTYGGTSHLMLIRKPVLVRADSVRVVRGRADDLNPDYLVAQDEARLFVCKFIVPNQQVPPVVVELEGTSPIATPHVLRAYGVSGVTSAGAFGEEISFFNWAMGTYQSQIVSIQSFDEYFEAAANGDLSEFVSPARRLRSRFAVTAWGPTTIPNWCVRHDQFLWTVE